MIKIWFEWPLPWALHGLLEGKATALGPATATPDHPFSAIAAADAVIAAADLSYTDEVFAQAKSLRAVCRIGVGYDNIDVASATRRGIAVCNAPDAPTISTAEHAIALVFAVAKQLPSVQSRLRQGHQDNYFLTGRGRELRGQTLGLVGFGRIGQYVAQLALGMGMIVVACDPHATDEAFTRLGVKRIDSLDTLLAVSNVISLHVPINDNNRHLLNRAAIERMQPGAILINTARGGLVDEVALYDSLKNGHLFGAGLDVFESEPPSPNHPLLQLDNVIATPHVASATDVSKINLWDTAIRQAFDVIQGRRPPHLVNPDVWD